MLQVRVKGLKKLKSADLEDNLGFSGLSVPERLSNCNRIAAFSSIEWTEGDYSMFRSHVLPQML